MFNQNVYKDNITSLEFVILVRKNEIRDMKMYTLQNNRINQFLRPVAVEIANYSYKLLSFKTIYSR